MFYSLAFLLRSCPSETQKRKQKTGEESGEVRTAVRSVAACEESSSAEAAATESERPGETFVVCSKTKCDAEDASEGEGENRERSRAPVQQIRCDMKESALISRMLMLAPLIHRPEMFF